MVQTAGAGHHLYDKGNNRIETSVDSAYLVRYWTLTGTPDLKAIGNYWGDCYPDSDRFVQTDYSNYYCNPPFSKLYAGGTVPNRYDLKPNFPNPFNPSTTIEFSLAKHGHVQLEVFNILGQRVRLLASAEYSEGIHQVVWDGKDESGNTVASGVYLYRIRTESYVKSRKMVILK